MHTSIKLDCPCEFINLTPINPLISKCEIKVCYVGDEPNRNHSIITKEVAREMANSLPGSPIVGFFNDATGDFEEHNRVINISNGKFEIKDITRPYGFVDLNAKCWFQKFLDDGQHEHEYLMTTGYLWTGQYPECRRIIDQGNNHSMELDEDTLNAVWSKDENEKPQFFIVNEAIISKLCILGETCEPCFEGSTITNPTIKFSFEDGFKEQLFSMIKELQKYLDEGGTKEVLTTYAVAIGDPLWNALYSYLDKNYCKDSDCIYRINGIFDEEGQKFAVLQNRFDSKYYRLNFSISNTNDFIPDNAIVEFANYVPTANPQFALNEIETFELEYKKKKDDKKENSEDKTDKENSTKKEESTEDKDKNSSDKNTNNTSKDNNTPNSKKDSNSSNDEEDDEEKKKKKKYNLDEVVEYQELKTQYAKLQNDYNTVVAAQAQLNTQIAELMQFKAQIERKDKQAMIDSFYMLSDTDKADVVQNIDTYSLDDIEAKLSIICVRNKVSFDLDRPNTSNVTTFNLNYACDDSTPAWVKAALETANAKN